MPDEVLLPDGGRIRYRYGKDNPLGPARRFKNDLLTGEYGWLDPLRLETFRDHDRGLEQSFSYNERGMLDRIRVTPLKSAGEKRDTAGFGYMDALLMQGQRETLRQLLGNYNGTLDLFCGCDQVGTVRALTDARGRLIKEIRYDSFGRPLDDSFPELFVPVGFAGGLIDPDTKLTRFGWRDYDPTVGRFTAPDPLGDTGGDHDPYDYCVDDPVGSADPKGLKEEKVEREANALQKMAPIWAPHDSPEYEYAVRELTRPSVELGRGMTGVDGPPIDPIVGILRFLIPDFKKNYDEVMENAKKKGVKSEGNWLYKIAPIWAPHDSPEYGYADRELRRAMGDTKRDKEK